MTNTHADTTNAPQTTIAVRVIDGGVAGPLGCGDGPVSCRTALGSDRSMNAAVTG